MSDTYGFIMEIENIKLPKNIINFYLNSGIKQLYPPQADAIKKGLLRNKNILAAIPTASGKTLIAELAMLKAITENGKALYIVPLRALASEKYDRFLQFDILGVKTTISTGDFESKDEKLGDINDIIVTTSEKADSLLRNKTAWMEQISVIVVDEVHLIDSSNRGPTLEMIITKFRKINPRIQIIALSATIGNANELGAWLDAELILSEWRPTDLREGVFFEDSVFFSSNNKDDKKQTIPKYSNDISTDLVIDIIKKDGQCLVFDNSRRNAIGVACKASTHISKYISKRTKNALLEIAKDIIESGETEVAEILGACVKNGVAFHHAGLNSNHRKLVEKGFKENKIKMIASTPTLAAGLNLPARRVIIKNYKRYDSQFGMQPIPVIEYKQMAGRAGRPHLDPYGESILIAKSDCEYDALQKDYIYASPEPVLSKLGTEQAIRSHVLSLISTGFANNRDELMDFMTATFYSYQNDNDFLMQVVDECIEFLQSHEMIIKETNNLGEIRFFSTKLGNVISCLYIDPLSGANIVDGLKKSDSLTDLSLLHLICTAPDMRQLYLRSADYESINDFVVTHKSDFIQIPSQFKAIEYEWFLGEVKTAILLKDWIDEMQITTITKKFNIGEGDVRVFTELGRWLMHATTIIAGILNINNDLAKILEKRIQYGVGNNLVELAKIRGIGRVRARLLYKNGFESKEDIKNADFKDISKIIGHKLALKIFQQMDVDFVYENEIIETIDSDSKNQTMIGDF